MHDSVASNEKFLGKRFLRYNGIVLFQFQFYFSAFKGNNATTLKEGNAKANTLWAFRSLILAEYFSSIKP